MIWTPYEEKQLIQLRAKGKTTREIANALHRSYESIEHKIHRLGLEFKREEKKKKERIAFGDLECSSLTASFGIIYTFCLKKLDGPIIKRKIDLKDLHSGLYDKNLVKQFIEDCEEFDRLVFHYGTDRKFDLPFIRTRAVYWGLPFPEHKFMWVGDTHPILKNKFKLHSNRLEAACDFFGIPSKKHRLNTDIWLKMITGNKKLMQEAIDYIMIHNVEDVVSLELLWKKIYKYVPYVNTSI